MDRDRFPVDPWRLTERIYSEDRIGLAETIFTVANGYLGMRGNTSEGRHAHEHGTYINGLHEVWPIRHAEQAYGFAEVGQTIVNAPDAKIMRLYVDDEPFVLDIAELLTYERELDFRDGVLRRELLWLTPSKWTHHFGALAGVGPDSLRIRELLARLGGTGPATDETDIAEVIIATDPNTEGEATATYLVRLLRDFPGLTVTRPASGLPMGGDLEFADELTLGRALSGRRAL